MMTKDQLRNYLAIKAERKQLEALLEEIESPLYSAKIQQLTGMPHAPSSTGSGSAQERLADRTMELRAMYAEKISELADQQLAIEAAIDSLEPVARMLLRCLYIKGMKWRPACDCIHYSRRQANRIHDAALEQLKKEPEA